MAFRKHLQLPRFQLTRRSTSGAVVQKDVGRGLKASSHISDEEGSSKKNYEPPCSNFDMDFGPVNETGSEPTFYAISQKASVTAWNSMRQSMLEAVTESYAMPEEQVCTFCFENLAQFRCVQCGPCSYYCAHCLPKLHLCSNIFHIPEEWKASILLPTCKHCL